MIMYRPSLLPQPCPQGAKQNLLLRTRSSKSGSRFLSLISTRSPSLSACHSRHNSCRGGKHHVHENSYLKLLLLQVNVTFAGFRVYMNTPVGARASCRPVSPRVH
jgi:hypothetical protein